ncbi:MAG: hypothetical protein IH955_08715, partial [Chloroflexi bacterium]|nr:hypothetical protein [Chloroflexota bacterium]
VVIERRAGGHALVPRDVMSNRSFMSACLAVLLMSPLFFVALAHLRFVMGRTVAKDPDAGLVVEIGLAIDVRHALLRSVRQPQSVLVEVIDELALGR